jgi:hypothetical protein
MVIYHEGKPSFGSRFKKEFNLIPNKYLGFSYYLNPSLSILGIGTFDRLSGNITPKEANNKLVSNNVIRVSDVAAPTVFPARNTYTIGNGDVIGFARLQLALSDDTFGRNPLLVFCTDGIYTMEVDASGVGAYTSINMLSNEICVNANTICEIAGGVVFASSKGLMVVTSNGVSPFVPLLNGKPRHTPNDGDKTSGMEAYSKIKTEYSIKLNYDDFINTLKNNKTHVVYIAVKNKLYIYNTDTDNSDCTYWVDIENRVVTRLPDSFIMHDNDTSDPMFLTEERKVGKFKYEPSGFAKEVFLQTRPMKLAGGLKSAIRVILRGRFHFCNGANCTLAVLGSVDGERWELIGANDKVHDGTRKLNVGCVVERVSVNYIMVIFAASVEDDTNIDHIELTVNSKYNNKLR